MKLGSLACLGHYCKLSVVVNPRTWLMCLLEVANLVVCVDVCPSVAHATCLRHPEVHAPRQGNGRIGVAC